MSAQEHTFTFCQIFFISGGNYTLITCIQYTTMVTHSECEISQSWRTQFSSHGALNLNRAVMPPPLPLHIITTWLPPMLLHYILLPVQTLFYMVFPLFQCRVCGKSFNCNANRLVEWSSRLYVAYNILLRRV